MERDLSRKIHELERELSEARQQQVGTSEILSILSSSPTNVQPVFNAIARSAVGLCDALYGFVGRFDGELMHIGATHNYTPQALQEIERAYPMRPDRSTVSGRVILTRSVVHIPDVREDPEYSSLRPARRGGWRAMLGVPMLRQGDPIGMILVVREQPGPFSETQIKLLKTFADQAVIAIENTRLFEAEQASKRELQESLNHQTATSEILGVISRSPTDVEPVFQTIARSAAELCDANNGSVFRFEGGLIHLASFHNLSSEITNAIRDVWPAPPDRGSVTARAILTRSVVHISDVTQDSEYTASALIAAGFRTGLAVPMMRAGEPIGAITVARMECRPFTARQIDLLKTFADQAVIAISNVGLFEEVRARNRDLTALGEVGRAVSSTLDLEVVLKTIVERAVSLSGTHGGAIFYYREDVGSFELGETAGLANEVIDRLQKLEIVAKDTALGDVINRRQPIVITDLTKWPTKPLRAAAIEAGLRASLIVPLISAEGPIGTLVLLRRNPGEFSQTVVTLMQSFADQSAIALENARLFDEIAQKSRELEIASQHKSQFVANMSHELRTPLAAILGYAELMQEGFYEPLGQKSLDALTRIRSNGKHLLGLINTVLDIAKIESGQFTLNMAEYALGNIVETVRSATESLAETKKLALMTHAAKSLPIGFGDEQRLTQVLLNLVGNAIKFTDTGEVRVTASAANSHFTVSVTDTGPGIPGDQLTRVFEQFHQVDNSNTKAKGGTGLGLAISKQIVEMHGGRIWVESVLGKGATFHMELPIRAAFKGAA
jgi:signal transduction histidine kinase